mgnify:FL=1
MAEKAEKAVKTEKPAKTEKKEKKPFFLIRFFRSIKKFFRDTFTEMKKIVWPSKKQVINNTLVVIAVVILAGLVIFGLDNLFGLILKLILRT